MNLQNLLKKKYHQFFIWLEIKRRKNGFQKKIKRYLKHSKNVDEIKKDLAFMRDSRVFLNTNFNGYKNLNWHLYFASFNGLKRSDYIPEDLFFSLIEPSLNKYKLVAAYTDKNSYDNFIPKSHLPETVVKLVNGKYFDRNNTVLSSDAAKDLVSGQTGELVLKPAIESGAGRNITIDLPQKIASMLNSSRFQTSSYVIQKKVLQYHSIAAFHPQSLNTLKIITARIGREIVVISAYLRIGRNAARLDNTYAGGIICGLTKEGKLKEFAIDVNLNRFYSHPNSGEKFENAEIPNFTEVKEFCIQQHQKLIHFTLVSWDMGIDLNAKQICI